MGWELQLYVKMRRCCLHEAVYVQHLMILSEALALGWPHILKVSLM